VQLLFQQHFHAEFDTLCHAGPSCHHDSSGIVHFHDSP
jgi:hypothetical protein